MSHLSACGDEQPLDDDASPTFIKSPEEAAIVIPVAECSFRLLHVETSGANTVVVVGEHGAGLSVGQRQLICFARAMLANPHILILDEATSAVDTLTESRLQHALERLLQGRTSFVVAHRLSTIRHASQVLVLDQGQIVERGTHDELVAHDQVYARLYEQFIQATSA